MAEHRSPKPGVGGSNPSWSAISFKRGLIVKSFNPVSFYNQVRDELKKVNWPTKETTISTSIVVVVVVGLITAYLGIVDAIVSRLAQQIIG